MTWRRVYFASGNWQSPTPCAAPPASPQKNKFETELEMNNVLFLCRTNSAVSLIAEALTSELSGGAWRAASAGPEPATTMNAYTTMALRQAGISTPPGLKPKSWRGFSGADAPKFEVVVTLSEDLAWDDMPVWNGVPRLLHWVLPDPLGMASTPSERLAIFTALVDLLRAKVEMFLEEEARSFESRNSANDNIDPLIRKFGT
jgi:arsenate reductase